MIKDNLLLKIRQLSTTRLSADDEDCLLVCINYYLQLLNQLQWIIPSVQLIVDYIIFVIASEAFFYVSRQLYLLMILQVKKPLYLLCLLFHNTFFFSFLWLYNFPCFIRISHNTDIAKCMCITNMGKRWHQDALWGEKV